MLTSINDSNIECVEDGGLGGCQSARNIRSIIPSMTPMREDWPDNRTQLKIKLGDCLRVSSGSARGAIADLHVRYSTVFSAPTFNRR